MPAKRSCRACGDPIPYALRRHRYCSDWCRQQATQARRDHRGDLRRLMALLASPKALQALGAIDVGGVLAPGIEALRRATASREG